ncbi:MAG: single-stranded DNA-binding protein [Clostridia bacterium]|nr:single-stranded DNA-binding protein [Clostridia bacterium]
MNKVILLGRLTKEPEVKMTASQVSFCNFTIAVDRRFKDTNGQRQADFISCVAWRQTAQFIGSYFHKGSKILVGGSIQSRSYDDANGQKRYVTEVVVDEVDFADSGRNDGQAVPNGYGSVPTAPQASYSAPAAPVAPTAPAAPTAPMNSIPVDPSMNDGFGPADSDDTLPFEI